MINSLASRTSVIPHECELLHARVIACQETLHRPDDRAKMRRKLIFFRLMNDVMSCMSIIAKGLLKLHWIGRVGPSSGAQGRCRPFISLLTVLVEEPDAEAFVAKGMHEDKNVQVSFEFSQC